MTRPVIYVETGGCYWDIEDAAQTYRCKSGYIRHDMAHEYPVRGFHFKRERGEGLH